MKNNNENKNRKPNYVIKVLRTAKEKGGSENIPSDIMGSYTGRPFDGEVPEQDADDL